MIRAEDPSSEELLPIARLRGADRIQLEVSRFPGEDSLAAWKKLAAQGIELVAYRTGLPTEDEVRRLNEASFARAILVLESYPGPEDAERLGRIRGDVSITFAAPAYPRMEDKHGLLALPARMPLLFVADYWPWYTHMDLFNLLPHPRRLRVAGSALPEGDALEYLRHIQRLVDVNLETEAEPADSDWDRLAGIPATWTCRGCVPSAAALEAFARSGRDPVRGQSHRRLVIDRDPALTAEERARLERSPLPVEWIHEDYEWSRR